jgi:hypothetical protein
MEGSPLYLEEAFGILTDDDLYPDCVLVKLAGLAGDGDLRALRAWVPRYPLTKSSIITCARQEVAAYGPDGRIAHLVFDLRGTGDSEGSQGDRNFAMDLQGIKAWAEERFGAVNFGFFGLPEGRGVVQMAPIRPGVAAEFYLYRPPGPGDAGASPPLIYLSTYGNFDRVDDALCAALAAQGYVVLGLDPLRYLLHASARERLLPADLAQDMTAFCAPIAEPPVLVGQPISAGLALLWASTVEKIGGVIAVGRAQAAFQPGHIFKNYNPHPFFLGRYASTITPRPVAFVLLEGHPLGGQTDELASLYETAREPRRFERAREVSPTFLLDLLSWLQKSGRQ